MTCEGSKGRQEHFVDMTDHQHPALHCLTSPVRKRALLFMEKQRSASSELCQVMPAVAVEDVQNRVRHTVCLSQMEVSNFAQSCACQSSGACAYANYLIRNSGQKSTKLLCCHRELYAETQGRNMPPDTCFSSV